MTLKSGFRYKIIALFLKIAANKFGKEGWYEADIARLQIFSNIFYINNEFIAT